MADIGELRRSAPASTFGPGAIVDFRDGDALISAVVTGLEEWDRNFPPAGMANPQSVREERLERRLQKSGFRLPPVIENERERGRLVAVRFPKWLQCPRCNTIAESDDPQWGRDEGKSGLWCTHCTNGRHNVWTVPVRFIVACEDGHLNDFPWHGWVRHREECKNRQGPLKLETKAAGLAGLVLSCGKCSASRTMEDSFAEHSMRGHACAGKRPWLPVANEHCGRSIRVMQRGATNLYYPVDRSALSIPPWSDGLVEALGVFWHPITNIPDAGQREIFIRNSVSPLQEAIDLLGLDLDGLIEAVESHVRLGEADVDEDLRPEEYRQFVFGINQPDQHFECRREEVPDDLRRWFSTLARVPRLREVRVLTGFTRIHEPGSRDDQTVASLSVQSLNWLPAVEVRGEGIFLELNNDSLNEWERSTEICMRSEQLRESWAGGEMSGEPPEMRFLLIHTLAHALMRQLTLECGYSSAALRERLYVSSGADGMAGLLIYTSASDADGTLGGLQRQGLPKAFERTLVAGIAAMEWCSSDPLCVEGILAATEDESGAVCHACAMAPETSCEFFNRRLDRATLIGTPTEANVGFFRDLIKTGA
jgi:hypothetical protein